MRSLKPILITVVAVALVLGSYLLLIAPRQQPGTAEHPVTVYLIEATPTDFFLVPVERRVEEPPSPEVALKELLKGPVDDEELLESVPGGVRLLDLEVRGGLATANFSRELVTNFPGGSLTEAYLLEAIVNTLTEFPDIEEVQILVAGEIIESIGGHILITKPLQRND
ncbi:MAG: GerMN domain-containing protein [Bacillota bacterium]|nr:GerMN domain-containing protein [Bacillota bacterium]HHT89702.1 GerMN domain-containing protein [Bacillota bacterium]